MEFETSSLAIVKRQTVRQLADERAIYFRSSRFPAIVNRQLCPKVRASRYRETADGKRERANVKQLANFGACYNLLSAIYRETAPGNRKPVTCLYQLYHLYNMSTITQPDAHR